jgi:hypothetical protein
MATVYELERLRCNLCGEVFTASAPAGIGQAKYDETVASMVGLLKYGCGLPFNRLERLEQSMGIPLPASTQWELVEEAAESLAPAYDELIRQAAQGTVLHNDDTTAKILDLMDRRTSMEAVATKDEQSDADEDRTGIFTSGIVSTAEGNTIAAFFTGRKHAGENLSDLLAHRAAELSPPIQMCDGLSRNIPSVLKTIVANCLTHARRYFVEVVNDFPDECRYVIEELGEVYRHDEEAKSQQMSPEQRLAFHQARSGPIMERLKKWLEEQFEKKKVEPNSNLGGAIKYMLKHWERLTLFLRVPGAPLDNNICERALKKAILHRKNSLFYKSEHGAHVGDVFMSLIYTSELCNANPFEYLVQLLRHAEDAAAHPERWLPWNYRTALSGPGHDSIPKA